MNLTPVLDCSRQAIIRIQVDIRMSMQREELDFHKIALRYSDQLSKDEAFTGLRAMIRRIGKVRATKGAIYSIMA
jgi:hypothetical protein